MIKPLSSAFALAALFLAPPSFAQDISSNLKANGIAKTLADVQDNTPDNHFAIGTLQTLRAVEISLQSRWRHNIAPPRELGYFLRLPIQSNPSPEPTAPNTLSMIVQDLLENLAPAKESLALAGNQTDVEFVLKAGDLWFDGNLNGQRDDWEGADLLLRNFLLSAFGNSELEADRAIRFDDADVHWLHAYTELVSSAAHVFLAFDPTPVLEDLEKQVALLEQAKVHEPFYTKDEEAALLARIAAQIEDNGKLYESLQTFPDEKDGRLLALQTLQTEIAAAKEAGNEELTSQLAARIEVEEQQIESERRAIIERRDVISRETRNLRAERDSILAKSTEEQPIENSRDLQLAHFRPAIQTAYLVLKSLGQTPNSDHSRAALISLKEMISQNKMFWAELEQEIDNNDEWIPNANQTAALGFELPENSGEMWQAVLAEFEMVLNGELLVPHPLFPHGFGINLAAYMENPVPLDLAGGVHGASLYPFAEKGPRISSRNWERFTRAFGRGGFMVALLYN